jgi:hypothetical protein
MKFRFLILRGRKGPAGPAGADAEIPEGGIGSSLIANGAVIPDKLSDALATKIPGEPVFTLGGSGDTQSARKVSIQFKDVKGNNLVGQHAVRFFVGSASSATPVSAGILSNPNISITSGGGGGIIQSVVTGVHMIASTNTQGLLSFTLNTTSTGTSQTVVIWVEINARLYVSGTFTIWAGA